MIPPPRAHRHRYHGVLAPNASLRAAVTALAPAASDCNAATPEKRTEESPLEALWRSPAGYLWAMLLARLYEATPLLCGICQTDMRIVAFVTDGDSVRHILEYIEKPGTYHGIVTGHLCPRRRSTGSRSPSLPGGPAGCDVDVK
jgi:hypothetical protein